MGDDRFTELYRRYGKVIFVRCRALLGENDDAEDATHETFLRVHTHLEHVPNEREALYWIYRVATNYCLNELRNRAFRPIPALLKGPGYDQAVEIEKALLDRDEVRRLIDAAHPKVKPVAWLYHVDGFEQTEVAAILALSRRTVINRLADFMDTARRFQRRTPS